MTECKTFRKTIGLLTSKQQCPVESRKGGSCCSPLEETKEIENQMHYVNLQWILAQQKSSKVGNKDHLIMDWKLDIRELLLIFLCVIMVQLRRKMSFILEYAC